MRRLFAILFVLLVTLTIHILPVVSAPPGIAVGFNVNVSHMAGNQSEATVAINPTNPQNVVVISNLEAGFGVMRAYTFNGGNIWATGIIANGDAVGSACCDPSLAFDSFGNLFFAFLAADLRHIQVAFSTDGGVTFQALGNVSPAFPRPAGAPPLPPTRPLRPGGPQAAVAFSSVDQPTITTGPGSVWITYQGNGVVQAQGAAVTGKGQVGAFSPPQAVPFSFDGNFGDIAVGPAGQVMVTYELPSGGIGPAQLFVAVDPDGLGGAGFSPPTAVTTTNVGGFRPISAQPHRTIDAEAALAWDRSGGSHNGRVYFLYTDAANTSTDDTNLFLRYSDTNGASWSAPVRVNDDAGGASQFLPRMALDPTTGNLAISWYDTRLDTGAGGVGDTDVIANDDAQLWATVSTTNGTTFLPNFPVSAGTSNAPDALNFIEYGDYTGLAFYGGVFFPAWADNSNSTGDNPDGRLHGLDIYTARVAATSPFGATGAGAGADALNPHLFDLEQLPAAPATPAPTATAAPGMLPRPPLRGSVPTGDECFLRALYRDALGRGPDGNALALFLPALAQGVSRSELAFAVVGSPEARAGAVAALYQQYTGRAADAATSADLLSAATGSTEQLRAAILGSAAYYAAQGGTDDGWVGALYRDLLGRPPTADERAQALTQLSANAATRAQLTTALIGGTEYRGRLLDQLYQQYLGRNATPAERDAFAAASIGEERGRATVLGSDEYLARQGCRQKDG